MRNDQILYNIQNLGIHINMYTLDYTDLSTKSNGKISNSVKMKNSISKKKDLKNEENISLL